MRLTSSECTEAPTTSNLSEWLSNNSQCFSEWSPVCLISAVTEPIVKLTNLNNLLLPTSKPSSASSYSDNQLVELKLEMSFPQGYVLKKENELLRLEKTEYKQVINRLNDKIVRLEVHNAVQRIKNKGN